MSTICLLNFRRIAGVVFLLMCAATARAGTISASATVSTSSTSAPYNYTITLHNTGGVGADSIGTFWFAWTDNPTDYDFLPSLPTSIGGPASWLTPTSHNGIAGDGYGIEYYNFGGSQIAPGGSATFTFTSNDSPSVLSGPAFIGPNHVTTSFVYSSFPLSGDSATFVATVVPEPTSFALAGLASCGLLFRRFQASQRARRATAS